MQSCSESLPHNWFQNYQWVFLNCSSQKVYKCMHSWIHKRHHYNVHTPPGIPSLLLPIQSLHLPLSARKCRLQSTNGFAELYYIKSSQSFKYIFVKPSYAAVKIWKLCNFSLAFIHTTSDNIFCAALFHFPQQDFCFIQQMDNCSVLPSSYDPLNAYHLHPTLDTKTLHFPIDMFMQICPQRGKTT